MGIYCDHNATTPMKAEVVAAMIPFLREHYGNPSSAHRSGSYARCAIEEAREHVAALVNVQSSDVIFCSGGTEANNLAIFGALRRSLPGKKRILTTPIEHSSVRNAIELQCESGFEVLELAVDSEGRLNLDQLEEELGEDVALLSFGWANNEIATVQDVARVSELCRESSTPCHVDAVQACGKIEVDGNMATYLSISAHKIGGPKGIGALCVRDQANLQPLLVGGQQERGLRAGTENVAGIVGFGVAAQQAVSLRQDYQAHTVALRDALWQGLRRRIPGVQRNGPVRTMGLPNTLNCSFEGIRGEAMVAALDLEGIAVSSGSACAAGSSEPSHVLLALGQSKEDAANGLRFSFGMSNQRADVEEIVEALASIVERSRQAAAKRVVNG